MWAIRLYFCSVELKKTCLWQPRILNHTSFHFSSPRNWLITWTGKLVHLKGSRNQMCAMWFLSLWRQSYGSKLFHSKRDTVIFFHIALQIFWEYVELRCWTKLWISVFHFKYIPYRLWHKCRVYHSAFPRTMIHKETPFTGCQQIKSLGKQSWRAQI